MPDPLGNDPQFELSEGELDAFRMAVREFIERSAPIFSGGARRGLSQEADLLLGRRWQQLKSERGYAAITLPRKYGGGGGTQLQKIIFAEEESKFDFPTHYFGVSLSNPLPIMAAYATESQKD